MGRFYDITAGGYEWTSTGASGDNPGALQIECDITVAPGDAPAQGSMVRVWGVGLDVISQANSLFNQPFQMMGGMSAGLPLANPAEQGLLVTGSIYQALGKWEGVEQYLELYLTVTSANVQTGSGGPNPTPVTQNLVMNWPKGQDITGPLQQALQQAYPGFTVNMNIAQGQYTAVSDQTGFHQGIENFAYYIRRYTQMLGGANSQQGFSPFGVDISFDSDGQTINVGDGSMPTSGGQINYQDLIGQPTWIGVDKISIKVVMRGDLHIGNMITLPQTLVTTAAGAGSSQLGASASGAPQSSLTFQGTFTVTSLRHVGNFRQPDAASWVTIIEAVTVSGSA